MNGRNRRWPPRGTGLDEIGDRDIQEIAMVIDLAPRERSGHSSSVEVFL